MSDNWNSLESTFVPVHQHQQSEPSTSGLNHPHHSRTTPGWNNQTTTMVSDPISNDTNDTIVSSGRYESSPDNKSPESNRYSPYPSSSGSYTNAESPVEFSAAQSNEGNLRSELMEEQMDVVSSSIKSKRERPVARSNRFEFECPLCGYKSFDRDVFWKHLRIHYNPNRIEGEPEVPQTLDIPGCSTDDILERIAKHEEDINYPIINAQGKVKVNRCKVCKFHAITKVEFWRHIKIHTKPEKTLSCRYCPFVTDLKHHYEYHMNKQTGAKPFACKICNYTCVNKSMLSSHMKSHTDLRQFSCRNCTYVTKYCHSLKMHLRKYNHKPGPVLNPDGTINQMTTIDVYGTRRGPKQKKPVTENIVNQHMNTSLFDVVQEKSNADQNQTVQLPKLSLTNDGQPMMMNNLLPNSITSINPFSGVGLNSLLAMQYNNILRANLPNAEPYTHPEEPLSRSYDHLKARLFTDLMMSAASTSMQQDVLSYYTNQRMEVLSSMTEYRSPYVKPPDRHLQEPLQVLDLSTSNSSNNSNSSGSPNGINHNTNNNNIIVNNNGSNIQESQNCIQPDCSPTSGSINKSTGTSRRKGRAVKLNRRSIKRENEDELQTESSVSERGTPESCASIGEGSELPNNVITVTDEHGNTTPLLKCTYCPILFGSDIMYTIHMGYHGYNNPFTCNACGQKCEDAVSFNIHLSRMKHA